MKLLLLRHFAFDDPAAIVSWAEQAGCEAVIRDPAEGIRPEWLDQYDALIIMGGPMSVYQEAEYPWLAEEKALVRSAIDRGKKVLGICLGAQMIAEVLGARVYRASHKEIGWHAISRTAQRHPWLAHFPEQFESYAWHGDTFDLPASARLLAASEACAHQAFAYGEHVLGLQFHLETTSACIDRMLADWADELRPAPYIQTEAQIRAGKVKIERSHGLLQGILERMADQRS